MILTLIDVSNDKKRLEASSWRLKKDGIYSEIRPWSKQIKYGLWISAEYLDEKLSVRTKKAVNND